MKSQVNALLLVTQGLIRDYLAAYPADEVSLSKDFDRLARLSRERGIGLFTLDLPHLESLLLKGLESGRLSLEGPLSHAVSKRVQLPRLFSGIWMRVFDYSACLKQDVDATALAFLRQFLVLGKKLELGCSYDRTQAIVRAYHDIEHKLRNPSLGWGGDSLDDDGSTSNDGNHYCECTGLLPFSYPSIQIEESEKEIDHDQRNAEAESGGKNCDHIGLSLTSAVGGPSPLPLFEQEESSDNQGRLTDYRLLRKIQQVADLITSSIRSFDPSQYSEELESNGMGLGFKHGPGAVAERLRNWDKSRFPNWPAKLQRSFPFETCGKTVGDDRARPPNHEVASRLIAVPKTSKGPRLIAAEPVAHQWCQQALLKFLFDECSRLFRGDFIDFKDQAKSGRMVLEASLSRSLATVDLSDASDRLSCWVVERMFRANRPLLTLLHSSRTRYLRDDISQVKSFLYLKKFASQGTAVTFPVMSLVMLIIALGSSLGDEKVTWSNIWKLRTRVRVFGDDIIIPSHGYVRLCRAMELLQLKVNTAKSYVDGHFRESCGTDGFQGYDITPVKPKTLVAGSPASCQAVVDTSNNLHLKGYWHASTACLDLLPPRIRRGLRVVGPYDTGYRGVTSFSGGDEHHLKRRWSTRLHRLEVRVWGVYPQTSRHLRSGYSTLLDFFASQHSHEQARTVSEYVDTRKTKHGLRWEPSSCGARLSALS